MTRPLNVSDFSTKERCAGRSDIGAAGIAREVGVEPALMGDDEHIVPGDVDIQLQRVDADRQRVGERLQVFFRKTAAASGALPGRKPWLALRGGR